MKNKLQDSFPHAQHARSGDYRELSIISVMHLLEYFELTEHPYRNRDSSNDMITGSTQSYMSIGCPCRETCEITSIDEDEQPSKSSRYSVDAACRRIQDDSRSSHKWTLHRSFWGTFASYLIKSPVLVSHSPVKLENGNHARWVKEPRGFPWCHDSQI